MWGQLAVNAAGRSPARLRAGAVRPGCRQAPPRSPAAKPSSSSLRGASADGRSGPHLAPPKGRRDGLMPTQRTHKLPRVLPQLCPGAGSLATFRRRTGGRSLSHPAGGDSASPAADSHRRQEGANPRLRRSAGRPRVPAATGVHGAPRPRTGRAAAAPAAHRSGGEGHGRPVGLPGRVGRRGRPAVGDSWPPKGGGGGEAGGRGG